MLVRAFFHPLKKGNPPVNRDDLRREAAQLKAEVRAKTAMREAGEITNAEYASFIDKAYKRNESIQSTMQNMSKALAIANPADDTNSPAVQSSRDPDAINPMTAKSFMERYERLRRAAKNKDPNQSFSFDIAVKTPGFRDSQLVMKTTPTNPYGGSAGTQGVTGLQGEGASGTTAYTGLPGAGTQASPASDYFLAGPGGPDITPQWVPGILELRWYENVIATLMPTFPTDSPVVSYVRETAWNNQSAATPEGGQFPTSTNTIQRYSEEVGKVTNISRVTDEEIQDSQYFWALVQKRTTMGVSREEEVQLLAGSGYPGVNGLLNRTGEFTQAQTVPALSDLQIPNQANPGVGALSAVVTSVTPGRLVSGAGDTYPDGYQIVEALLAAMTDIRINHFFEPTAIVLNPLDWFIIRTMKDNLGQYMAGSMFGWQYGNAAQIDPAIQATDVGLSLWGKRVVSTPACPQGLCLVGDFTDATAVLRRGGMRVEIVNTNGFDFEQGMWTMRAYTRVGLAVYRPELFELVQFAGSGFTVG